MPKLYIIYRIYPYYVSISVKKQLNFRTVNYILFYKRLPFTGNGFAGGVDTDCITPEFEFLKTAVNEYGVYDVMDGAELYKITKEGEEILLGIYAKDKKRFVRLEDIL